MTLDDPGFACVAAIAAVAQQVVGDALGDPLMLDLDKLASRFAHVPAATSYNEAIMAVGLLLQFTLDLGHAIHGRLHRNEPRRCAFDPERCVPLLRVDRADPSCWRPATAVATWVRRFREDLNRSHDLIVERIRLRLWRDPSERMSVANLARDAASSASAMRRHFTIMIGETPLRHRTRLRVLDAIPLLRRGMKIEAVASLVGWKSKKDLYRAVGSVTGLTATEIRGLSDLEAGLLLARISTISPPRGPGLPHPASFGTAALNGRADGATPRVNCGRIRRERPRPLRG